MNLPTFLRRVPENAVFWLLLIFLAVGSAASLYGKAAGRELPQTASVSNLRSVSGVSASLTREQVLTIIRSDPAAGGAFPGSVNYIVPWDCEISSFQMGIR